MASTEQRLIERADALIRKGDAVLATHTPNPPTVIGFPTLDSDAFNEWSSQALVFLTNLLGESHPYARRFQEQVGETPYSGRTEGGIGILRAVREDLAGGYLFDIQQLAAGEIFDDFLEMAEHLSELGYRHAAASLAGAVLEEGLRKLAQANGQTVKSSDDLTALNHRLAQADVYSNLVRKRVQVWTDVRNFADHGEWEKVKADDVAEMVSGVRRFLTEHLG